MTLLELVAAMEASDPVEIATGPSELPVLTSLIDRIRSELGRTPVVAEIGSWCGETALAMALAGAFVVCVDPFTAADTQTQGRAHAWGGSTFERFCGNVLYSAASQRIVAVVGKSPEVAALFSDETFDLVFLDGDHSVVAVQADLAAWIPKVRVTGYCAGHDAGQAGVYYAVNEALADGRLDGYATAVTFWWARRAGR